MYTNLHIGIFKSEVVINFKILFDQNIIYVSFFKCLMCS